MHLLMSAVEDGTIPGPGLSVFETIVTFIVIPVGMFFIIAGLSWVGSRPRTEKKASAITSIE
jgi:hypothetical protein